MKSGIQISKLLSGSFLIFKNNLNLAMPLLMFLLFMVLFLSTLSEISNFIRLALMALTAVFIAGWFNMLKVCVKNFQNDNVAEDEKTLESFNLYSEFFPGVEKYFFRIFLGLILSLFLINVIEFFLFKYFGNFKSISLEDFSLKYSTQQEVINFWEKINPTDKARLFRLAYYNAIVLSVLNYLFMFWMQYVIFYEKSTLSAYILSIRAIISDSLRTIFIYLFAIFAIFLIFLLNIIVGSSFLGHLLILMLFVYFVVYYLIMTFLYFENNPELPGANNFNEPQLK